MLGIDRRFCLNVGTGIMLSYLKRCESRIYPSSKSNGHCSKP